MRGDHGAVGLPVRGGGPAALLVSLALLVAVTACGGTGDPGGEPADQGRPAPAEGATSPFPVDTVSKTFVDDSRPTEDPEDVRDAPTRTLETDIYVPAGPGPFPLIVQAHGFDGHPRKYTELVTAWAESGYVVALPTFPLTNDVTEPEGVIDDYLNQPADVAFVIDEVLRLSAGDDPVLGGRVDGERVGVAGHSLGGATAYGLAFNDCCRDDRIDAVALMSTLPLPFGDDPFAFEGVPVLFLQLTEDPIVPYHEAADAYDRAASPKFLVRLEGDGHFEPYEDAPSPHDEVVETGTIAFWDAYLGADPAAPDRLVEAVESADDARIAAEP